MKSSFNVYDPLVQQALQASGSRYVVPGPSSTPVNTAQPLSPDDMRIAQALQAQADAGEANAAAAGYAHQPQPAPSPAMSLGDRLSLDWQPPQSAPPMARMQAQPEQAPMMPEQPAPSGVSRAQPSAPMRSKARMDEAIQGVAGSFDDRQMAAAELGQVRAQTADDVARVRERSAVDEMMKQQELADAAEAHQAAVDKVTAQQQADTEFVRNYEPRDRRSIGQKAMGAIAVALAGFADAQTAAGGGQPQAVARTLGIINQSIDRDIELQQKMLDNKRTAITARNTELGQMRERYGDTQNALKLSYAMRIDQYQREIEGITAGGQSAEQAAIAKDAIAQLEGQKQQLFTSVYGDQYKQELRARQGVSLEKQLAIRSKMLDIQDKELDIEKKRTGEADQTADERKVNRQLGAVKPAMQRLEKTLSSGKTPYWGVREGTQSVPDVLVPNENIQYRNDVMAVAGQALRDDSGAVLGPKELSDKLERMGVFSGSEAMRRQGLKDLQYEYRSRLNRGKPAPQTPAEAARSRIKPGAAR